LRQIKIFVEIINFTGPKSGKSQKVQHILFNLLQLKILRHKTL